MQIQVDQYTTLQMQDSEQYGVSIIEGWIKDDGEFKARTCLREFKKGTGEKQAPVSVKLGDRAKAIEVALAILRSLTGRDYSPVEHKTQEEVPF